jgi:hypothetical protein
MTKALMKIIIRKNLLVVVIIDDGTGSGLGFPCYGKKISKPKKTKLHGLSPRANYTDRATAACRRSDFQLVRIEGATWSA